jgi:hypothetical protein
MDSNTHHEQKAFLAGLLNDPALLRQYAYSKGISAGAARVALLQASHDVAVHMLSFRNSRQMYVRRSFQMCRL